MWRWKSWRCCPPRSAWHGAWCWKRILPALWAAGHRAFAVSLSGVGERAHLGPAGITLDTHIQDVAAVIEAEKRYHRRIELVPRKDYHLEQFDLQGR